MIPEVTYRGLPRRRNHVEPCRAATRNLLIDHDRVRVQVLDDTALAVCVVCDGRTAPGEVVARLADRLGIDPPQAGRLVHTLLDELTRAGVLEWLVPEYQEAT